MKNSKLRRVLMLVACAVALVSLSVGATLAYLTATTDTVTNSFTVGNVSFNLNGGLDEAKVNVYGELVDANGKTEAEVKANDPTATFTPATRVTANSYKLVPGHEYVKDPTVHLAAGSESCYLFILVNKTDLQYSVADAQGDVTLVDIEAASVAGGYQKIADQIKANGWAEVTGITNTPTGATLYAYNTTVDTLDASDRLDYVIFNKFQLANNAVLPDSTAANELQIKIKAYAVQADGFASAADAWDGAAFDLTAPFN